MTRKLTVSGYAAIAINNMSNSASLPRQILAASQLSPKERIGILAALRRFHHIDTTGSFFFDIPETRALCQMVLKEKDVEVRAGAQQVLSWLNGDNTLLHPSEADTTKASQELGRAAQGGSNEDGSEMLMRGAEGPKVHTEAPPKRRKLWKWKIR